MASVRDRISRAAARAGRDPAAITLIAVSKTHPPEAVREAFAAGVRHFGENRVQEAESKIPALADLRPSGLVWHLIGHLQSNKAARAAELFDVVHSVDSASLARRLEKGIVHAHAGGHDHTRAPRVLRVLVQVDLAGEATKFGADESHLWPTLEALRGMKSVRACGLMIVPPYEEDPERVRPFFRRLRELRDDALRRDLLLEGDLSMGMSHDFEAAIEEGATHVRVGTAIFGERPRGTV